MNDHRTTVEIDPKFFDKQINLLKEKVEMMDQPTAARKSEIETELEFWEKAIVKQQEIINELQSRLEPILSKREIQLKTNEAKPREISTPLASRIHELMRSIDMNSTRLIGFLETIEL